MPFESKASPGRVRHQVGGVIRGKEREDLLDLRVIERLSGDQDEPACASAQPPQDHLAAGRQAGIKFYQGPGEVEKEKRSVKRQHDRILRAHGLLPLIKFDCCPLPIDRMAASRTPALATPSSAGGSSAGSLDSAARAKWAISASKAAKGGKSSVRRSLLAYSIRIGSAPRRPVRRRWERSGYPGSPEPGTHGNGPGAWRQSLRP